MLETVSQAPYVGLLHQAHTQKEMAQIKDSARGKMKATPLLIHARESTRVSHYTGRRTSKVVYRSEAGVPALEKTSRRLSMATRTVINKAQYDSENYQIMNYGLGGAILVHKDVDDPNQVDESYSVSIRDDKNYSEPPDLGPHCLWRPQTDDLHDLPVLCSRGW